MARARYKTGPKKGQFKPKAKRKAKRKAKPKTGGGKKRRARRSTPVARKKTRRRRRSKTYMTPTELAKVGGASAAIGYAKSKGYVAQIPMQQTFDWGNGVKGNAALAVLFHYGGKKLKSKWLARASVAAVALAGHQLGESGFQIQGVAGVGFDDAMDEHEAEVAGVI